jgi:hypothetical protein
MDTTTRDTRQRQPIHIRSTRVYGHLGGADKARVAARLHSSVDARTGKLPLRYDPAQVHWFDPASGKRLDA